MTGWRALVARLAFAAGQRLMGVAWALEPMPGAEDLRPLRVRCAVCGATGEWTEWVVRTKREGDGTDD